MSNSSGAWLSRHLLSLLFIIGLVSVPVWSQPDSLLVGADTASPPPSRGDKFLNDLEILGTDGIMFLTAPSRFTGTDWLYFGGTITGTGLSMAFDRDIRREVLTAHFSPTINDAFMAGTHYGELLYSQLFTVTVYVSGLALDNDDIRITGRMLAQTLLYSGTVTIAIRYLAGRNRPSGTDDPFDFKFFQKSNEVQSFPSGHTTVAFALSSTLASQIDHPVATVLLYGMATLTGVSRIAFNRHWASDVILGAVIGIVSGRFVSLAEERRNAGTEPEQSCIEFYPTFGGIAMSYRF